MENIKNNLFNLVRVTVFSAIVGLSVSNAQGVFITEIADPNNASAGGRFVELHNNTDADVDLTGWALRRWTNEILIHKLIKRSRELFLPEGFSL